jgi:hypothetical protein
MPKDIKSSFWISGCEGALKTIREHGVRSCWVTKQSAIVAAAAERKARYLMLSFSLELVSQDKFCRLASSSFYSSFVGFSLSRAGMKLSQNTCLELCSHEMMPESSWYTLQSCDRHQARDNQVGEWIGDQVTMPTTGPKDLKCSTATPGTAKVRTASHRACG